jgi:Tfp pilus assembly protein PilZ
MKYGHLTANSRPGVAEVLVCNLSRLGAYIAVRPALEVGEEIGLTFKSPDDTPLVLKAVVTWCSPAVAGPLPQGCGLRFVSMSKLDDIRLRAIVESASRARVR